MSNNSNQLITNALRTKIKLEEETLLILVKTEELAEDLAEHNQMILTQQQIINYYKNVLAKVSTNTNTSLH